MLVATGDDDQGAVMAPTGSSEGSAFASAGMAVEAPGKGTTLDAGNISMPLTPKRNPKGM
jgi:hypothetical protein